MQEQSVQQHPERRGLIAQWQQRLETACGQLGWGWGGAEISEVHDILRPCREMEKLGVADVWERAVRCVAQQAWSDADFLIRTAREYGKGMIEGRFRLWDSEPGFSNEKEQGNYILAAADRLEEAWRKVKEAGDMPRNPKHQLEHLASLLDRHPSPEAERASGVLAGVMFLHKLTDDAAEAALPPLPGTKHGG